ncbi:MAG TPA: DUF6351 family protein, partial [Nevskiaceae bacterium]|nr:DUF6351 family protein [Nevskiaceae bacterium]
MERKAWRAAGLAVVLALGACGGGGHDDGDDDGGGPTPTDADTSPTQADYHTRAIPPLDAGDFAVTTVSSMPDTVTGGDAVVAIHGLAPTAAFTVTRDGDDVTSAFSRAEDGSIEGLVEGLRDGTNHLVVASGGRHAQLVVENHPVTGPVISGPHQVPFICRTVENGLGASLDADCSAAPKVQWFYRSLLTQQYRELADPYAAYPLDTMTTQTLDGRAVPFVVRVESRTINRGIARIAVLDDPAARGAGAPFDASNWNHRVYYIFGESCGVGYHQGLSSPNFVLGGLPSQVSADSILINLVGGAARLGKGDAVVHSTLSAFGVHCNPLVSVETTMMIKEHIRERYGRIDAMVGTNGSGAALQQYNAINNAPGLIDAAMPTATFADIVTTAMTVTDCGLLRHYYATSALDWSEAKKAAVDGHNLLSGTAINSICQSWTDLFLSRIDARAGCDAVVPESIRYDAATNPLGVRCTLQDANVNIFGRDPDTGFARRPVDNTGVQYGLAPLQAGTISVEEFLDLNRHIGGFDIDGNFHADRMTMAPELESLVYRIGGVIGRGAIAETPVMDLAPYLDLLPAVNIHEAVRPFVVRARLRAHTGQDQTQSIWRGALTQADAYDEMEAWFTALHAATPSGSRMADVIAAKPASAGDRCTFGTIGGRLELPSALLAPLGLQLPLLPGAGLPGVEIPLRVDIPEDFDAGTGPCMTLLPVTRTPRMAAGMPLSDDIIKCQLRPLSRAEYPDAMTDAQFAEAATIFPDGVCDWTRPAAEDVAHSLLWPSIGDDTLLTDDAGRTAPVELRWRVARS